MEECLALNIFEINLQIDGHAKRRGKLRRVEAAPLNGISRIEKRRNSQENFSTVIKI